MGGHAAQRLDVESGFSGSSIGSARPLFLVVLASSMTLPRMTNIHWRGSMCRQIASNLLGIHFLVILGPLAVIFGNSILMAWSQDDVIVRGGFECLAEVGISSDRSNLP